MKRRDFIKLLAVSPLVPTVLCAKEKFGPSKQDKALAKLTEISDFGSCSGPFIWHKDFWVFADRDIIRWCHKDKLDVPNIQWPYVIIDTMDTFDFWVHDKGKLYWGGKHTRYEILSMAQDGSISIRFDCNFDD